MFLGLLLGLFAGVVYLGFLFKIWKFLPPERRRTSPFFAVGLMFVPLFNIYWHFVVTAGWAKDFNDYAKALQAPVRLVSVMVAVLMCVFAIIGSMLSTLWLFQPLIPLIGGLLHSALLAYFVFRACTSLNELGSITPPAGALTGSYVRRTSLASSTTLARRELGAYFLSPIAYVVLAIFLFSAGLAFGLGVFRIGEEASLRPLFDFWMIMILVFVLPMLTMRLVSDELRTGTIETLMTAPVTETEIIVGKFFGAMTFYLVLLGTILVYPILLAMYGDVDVVLLICNFIGVLLLGALYVAVSLFFSTCTKHQVVAVLFSFALLALMTFAADGLARIDAMEGWPRIVLQQLSVRMHFQDFVRGLLTLNHVVFFLSITAFFLFVAVKRLEMRRWQ